MAKRLKENKRTDENKASKKNVLIIIMAIIIIIVVVFFGVKYFKDRKNVNESSEVLNNIKIDETQITEVKTEKILKLEELQKENTDIVGWLEIEGTSIKYPVLQTEDNSFYMTHDYRKEKLKDGSLFLDKDYDWTIPSSNFLIYGHNNNNGLMFSDLMKYKQEDFYKSHKKISFITNETESEYEILAVFLSRVYYKSEKDVFRYYYFINASNSEEYKEYVENSKKASLYDTGVTAEFGEQLLTLSTCSYHTEDGRLAVVAKKIEKK